MIPKIFIIKEKPNISKISAATLKEIGFKSKAIAKNFAKLSDVNPKDFNTESALLTALKTKLNNFKKLGLEFNDVVKKINTATPKIKENRMKKQEKKNEELITKIDTHLKSKFYIDVIDNNNVNYLIKSDITSKIIVNTSDHYLKFKDFKLPTNKNYVPWEKTEHSRKKTQFLPFSYDIYKRDLSQFSSYLHQIFNDQKFTFKITFEFSFLLILSDDYRIITDKQKQENKKYEKFRYLLKYKLFYPSTNTRIFEHPIVVDNKKDIEWIINKVAEEDLISEMAAKADSSQWEFYKFLGVTFHIYEMNTPIGKANELPNHFKEGSNEKALIKYENYDDYLCFWRCLSYHQTKPEDPRNINKKMK